MSQLDKILASAGDPQRKPMPRGQLLIGSRWRNASAGATMTTTDPITEVVITSVAKGTPADIEEAVQVAPRLFEGGPRGRMQARAMILFRMADLLDNRVDDFALREAMAWAYRYKSVWANLGAPRTDVPRSNEG